MTSFATSPTPVNPFPPITRADLARAAMWKLHLPDVPLAVEPAPTKFAINGFTYEAREIPAGECGTVAYEVRKVDTGNHYAVIRNHFNEITCDCPDFELRRSGTGQPCKHGAKLVELGLIPASTPTPARTMGDVEFREWKRDQAARLSPRPRRFEPSPEEMAEAAQLFGDVAAERIAYRRDLASQL